MFFSIIGHAGLLVEQKKNSPNIWLKTTVQFLTPSSNLLQLWVATGMGDRQKFIVQAARRGSIQVHQHLRSPRRAFLSRGDSKTGWEGTFISHRSQGLAFTTPPPISEYLQRQTSTIPKQGTGLEVQNFRSF